MVYGPFIGLYGIIVVLINAFNLIFISSERIPKINYVYYVMNVLPYILLLILSFILFTYPLFIVDLYILVIGLLILSELFVLLIITPHEPLNVLWIVFISITFDFSNNEFNVIPYLYQLLLF